MILYQRLFAIDPTELEIAMFEAMANAFGLTEDGAAASNHMLTQLNELGITPSKRPCACIVFPMGDIVVTLEPEARRMRMWHRSGVLELLILPGGISPKDRGTIENFVRSTQKASSAA